MTLENPISGYIEVITGPMFSGKTEKLIETIERARQGSIKTSVFKISTDTRYSATEIVSHNKKSMSALVVNSSNEILEVLENNAQIIGIDEAQFFDMNLPLVCSTLANKGKRVIVAGLDKDYKGNPFGSMPHIMALAENVIKLNAICAQCEQPAQFTHRLTKEENQVLLGGKESYIPLCRKCYNAENINLNYSG